VGQKAAWLNELTLGIASTSVATLGKLFTCVSSGLLSFSSLIGIEYRLVMAGVSAGDAASAGWQVTLYV